MRRLVLSTSLLALIACSEDKPTPAPGPTNRDASTTSTSTMDGGSVMGDAAPANADATAGMDVMNVGMDATAAADAVVTLGPNCTDLEACCATLPAGQQQCFDRVAQADENACQMLLMQAQNIGQCLPPDHDAGERPEGGALSPECAALEPCCAQAGALEGACNNIVASDNASRCQQILDLLAGRGIMCGPADAGTTSGPDATVSGDAADLPDVQNLPDVGTATAADGG